MKERVYFLHIAVGVVGIVGSCLGIFVAVKPRDRCQYVLIQSILCPIANAGQWTEFNLPNDHYILRIAGLNEHTVKIIMISAFTVAIVTQLMGIWGAYKTNYCVCIIYGLIMIIAFIVSVLPALYTGYNAIWFLTGWFFLCSCFATSFASAIRRCRATRPALMGAVSARNATIVLAQPPPTIVYQLPPQSPYVNAGPPTPNVMYNSP
ncbi:unnamed protein product, partial [Medioppia subpectinata]